MMMGSALPTPLLLRCKLSAQKRQVILQHAVKDDQHLAGYCHDCPFRASSW
jgi:hypothetical protein